MSNKTENDHTGKLKILSLAMASMTLIACGEGVKTNSPIIPPLIPVQPRLLNDTGVKYSLGDENAPYTVMTRVDVDNIADAFRSKNNNNLINAKGEVFHMVTILEDNGNSRQAKEFDLDSNGNRIIEEFQMTPLIAKDGTSVTAVGPTIYTANPALFKDQAVVLTTMPPANFPGQDSDFGRDINQPSILSTNGFIFTKLDKENGFPLDASATEFGCVEDGITGLTWENKVKQDSSAYGTLHSSTARHTWYNPDRNTNGGDAGQIASATSCDDVKNDTYTFTQEVNAEKLCGYDDWRIPSNEELKSIVDYNVKEGNAANPMADPIFFPNIAAILHRWTSQTSGLDKTRAHGFHFSEGRSQVHEKYCDSSSQLRYHNGTVLVRGVYGVNN